jgi:hypothetical protein
VGLGYTAVDYQAALLFNDRQAGERGGRRLPAPGSLPLLSPFQGALSVSVRKRARSLSPPVAVSGCA